MKNKKAIKYVLLFGIIIIIPLAFNFLIFSWRMPGINGSSDAWISFLGNYSGGIIGGIVAYIVSRSQIKNLQETQNLSSLISQHPIFARLKIDIDIISSSILQFSTIYNQIDQVSDAEVSKEQIILGAHNLLPLNEENWRNLELIHDVNLQVELIQMKNDYTELLKAFAFNISDISNDIERIRFQLDKLSKKHNKTPQENNEFNRYLSEHLKLNTDYMVNMSKKQEYWEKILNGKLQEKVEKIKYIIDEEIIRIEKAKTKVEPYDFI